MSRERDASPMAHRLVVRLASPSSCVNVVGPTNEPPAAQHEQIIGRDMEHIVGHALTTNERSKPPLGLVEAWVVLSSFLDHFLAV